MAKQLNLDFETKDLGLKPEAGAIPSAVELSRRIINVVIMQYSEQRGGLIKAERAQAYWLRDALEKAAATDVKVLEAPNDVVGFLRKVFREVRMAPDKLLEIVEANVDKIKMD